MLQVMKNAIFLIFSGDINCNGHQKGIFSLIGVSRCMHRSMTGVATEARTGLILDLFM